MGKRDKISGYAVVVLFVVVAALVGMFRLGVFGGRWEPVPGGGPWQKWRRATVTHIDRNGDDIVDWEIDDQGRADDYLEREDTDFDGYFDMQFHRGVSGMPDNVVQIHQKAPRH